MTVTLAAVHEQLRRDTAKLLGYDYANLTAAAGVRLDRAAMLRLELDDCQQKKLSGQPFDMNKYVVASEALERLMGGDPATGTDGDFEIRYQARVQEEFAGAHEKFSNILTAMHGRIEARDASHPDEARLTFERELQAKIDKYKKDDVIPPKPTVEWVRDGTHCFFSEGFDPNAEGRRHGFVGWVRGDPSPQSAPAIANADQTVKQTPPEQTSPQPPLSPPSGAPPPGYLRRTDGFDVIQGGRFDRWSNRG